MPDTTVTGVEERYDELGARWWRANESRVLSAACCIISSGLVPVLETGKTSWRVWPVSEIVDVAAELVREVEKRGEENVTVD